MQVKKFIFEDISKEPSENKAAAKTEIPDNTNSPELDSGKNNSQPQSSKTDNKAKDSESVSEKIFPSNKPNNEDNNKVENKKNILTEKDLLKSRTDGYEEGYSKGYEAAKAKDETIKLNISETLLALKKNISELEKRRIHSEDLYKKETITAIIDLAKSISGNALKSNMKEKVKELFSEHHDLIFEQPKLYLVIHPSLEQEITKYIDEIKLEAKYTGIITIKTSDSVAENFCSLEWKGGGVVYDYQNFIAKLTESMS